MSEIKATVIDGAGVSGNIGSCEVKSTNVYADSWHTQVIAVNSCTGQVVYQSPVYYDWGYVYFPLLFVFVVLLIAGGLRAIFD